MTLFETAVAHPVGRWVTMTCLLLCLVAILTKDMIWREIMSSSSRKTREKNRRTKVVIEDGITRGIEAEVRAGRLTREQADYHYKILQRAGYKELGPEPSFGRPWYYGISVPPSVEALKSRIRARLGLLHKEALPEQGRTDIDEILNKFK
jgi:hypothetical protein